MNKFPQKIVLKNKTYSFVKERRGVSMGVYEGKDGYLRIGSQKVIKRELGIAKDLERYKFPVPKVYETGKINGLTYYLEERFRPEIFSYIFGKDVKKYGKISDKNFKKFVDVSLNFAKGQIRSINNRKKLPGLAVACHLASTCAELPKYKGKIKSLFKDAENALSVYPKVLTHGDFTTHNLFPKGAIDFQDLFNAPLGYDLVTAIVSERYFPSSKKYEFYAYYRFTELQRKIYYQAMDKLFIANNLPPLSPNLKWFEFCRAVWLTAGNYSAPKMQQFRYNLFTKEYLNPIK